MMPVDIAFELSYLLSDRIGREVSVESVEFEPEAGRLCVEVLVDGVRRRGCVDVKPCKGLRDESKWARCVARNLVNMEKLLDKLVESLGV